jgi:hypothetical protein
MQTEVNEDAAEGDAGAAAPRSALPERIGRYQVLRELGRGGMAIVYHVLDVASGKQYALKQLSLASGDRRFGEQAAAFEREYHALVQLSHPRIIEVYDFGADESGRYYTMELLDGGDLRELSPLPWQNACALFYDVCSSLALLHSRQLVHRDVSPRNVRRTRAGSAKLIDFGALVPFGTTAQVVGTPPFVPPEVLHRSTLDARTDLFSLGATLYFALTGRLSFPARDFSKLHEVWGRHPAPPSAIVEGIPPALDALVLSLISLDPAMRPRTAFEVMQRLAAVAGLDHTEATDVSAAYLSNPTLIGRDEALGELRVQIGRTLDGRGGSTLLDGPAGIGRSRMLDACALEAKLAGAVVLRVNAGSEPDEALATGQALARQLVAALPELAVQAAEQRTVRATLFEAENAPAAQHHAGSSAPPPDLPRLRPLSGRAGDRAVIQEALTGWLMEMAKAHPLVVLIDDVHRVDEASLALLAALVLCAPSRKLLFVAASEHGVPGGSADAFAVLKRECKQLALGPLDPAQVETLLVSMFGDVPNLALLADRVFTAAAGVPRETLELVQSLCSRGLVRYEGGQWVLPAQLPLAELPSSAAEACKQRVAQLSPLARLFAELLALASHPSLSRADFAHAAWDVPAQQVDAAITELLAQRVFAGDGFAYVLSRREWSDALLFRLDEGARGARHRMLAEIYAKDPLFALERVHHLFAGGNGPAGVDLLMELLSKVSSDNTGLLSLSTMRAERIALVVDRALTAAEVGGRKPRDCYELRRALFAIAIVTDEAHYLRAAPAMLAQLRRDSGLDLHDAITDAANPGDRLMRALTAVSKQYEATPEHERVLDAEHAIRGLVYFVAISIAIGSRVQDSALIASLPALLEPFAPLSPLIHAVWQNAIATRETIVDNRPESAHTRWFAVLEALAKISTTEMAYVEALRGAIRYGVGLIEARLGYASAEHRATQLDDDPYQKVSAVSLRRIARLHKGDFAGAERFRKQAEALALNANIRQMFQSTLPAELIAHALAGDLTGIRADAERIAPLAARFPGWAGYKHLAEGCFEQARGQLDSAREAFERGLAVSEPDPDDPHRSLQTWPRLEAAYVDVLVQLGRAEQARARGLRALERCAQMEIGLAAFPIRRALALAEAKLGDHESACARLEAVISELQAVKIRGLELGATYEARARVAIWSSDSPAIDRYGRLTAEEYRYGEGSALGARYERLMDEARNTGVIVLPELSDFQTKLTTSNWRSMPSIPGMRSIPGMPIIPGMPNGSSTPSLPGPRPSRADEVPELLAGTSSPQERASKVLALLCEARSARAGHLYLHTEKGLELVASHGAAAPGEALQEYVSRYVTEQLETDSHATAIEDHAGRYTSAAWVDPHGVAHQPALIMGELDGMKVCAGAAVIEAPARMQTEVSTQQLLDSVANYLLRSGDARGAVNPRERE